jgi:ankyrin repeat protein
MSLRSFVRRARSVRLGTFLVVVTIVSIASGLWADRVRRGRIREALRDPIISAAERGQTGVVRALLDRGADVNSVVNGRYPWTPLMHAAFRGHTETARLLLDRGADVDHPDLDSFTAVTIAAGEGYWDIVRLLAEHRADLRLEDGYGKTPLDYANEAGNREMAALLERYDRTWQKRRPDDQPVPSGRAAP